MFDGPQSSLSFFILDDPCFESGGLRQVKHLHQGKDPLVLFSPRLPAAKGKRALRIFTSHEFSHP